DGVLAIFPIEGEGGTAEAVRRATTAVDEALRLRAEMVEAGTPAGAPLEFGIGLDIGELMFGNIGVPHRLAFSGIGRVVNGVQRIESTTKKVGRQVLATAAVVAVSPGDWVSAGAHGFAGLDGEIELFARSPARVRGREAAE
ncbi:MAG: adenylate/guanylate cyclase domain-containing protein, partial [Proteobacteria bacterium]|nr:adenylate/guanylate cyclase domain-containing protein [Pseudomonadota bacterium]